MIASDWCWANTVLDMLQEPNLPMLALKFEQTLSLVYVHEVPPLSQIQIIFSTLYLPFIHVGPCAISSNTRH